MSRPTRKTRQKELIKRILCSTTCHPTADWIYSQARSEMPNISLGTIYRNLNLMKEAGEILELDYGSNFSRYDGNPEPHYHFSCLKCSNVYDLELKPQTQLNKKLEEEGFEIQSHRLEFQGLCPRCKSN